MHPNFGAIDIALQPQPPQRVNVIKPFLLFLLLVNESSGRTQSPIRHAC